MFGLGTTELIVIGVIVFFIFGAKRLPDIGKGLGGAVREFRNVKKDLKGVGSSDQQGEGSKAQEGEKKSDAIESRITEKVLGQVPGVKKAMSVKKKVDQVKKIMD
jgi:sec-independent protein translocase protein TatA